MKEILVGIWLTLKNWRTRLWLKGFKYLFEKEQQKKKGDKHGK